MVDSCGEARHGRKMVMEDDSGEIWVVVDSVMVNGGRGARHGRSVAEEGGGEVAMWEEERWRRKLMPASSGARISQNRIRI